MSLNTATMQPARLQPADPVADNANLRRVHYGIRLNGQEMVALALAVLMTLGPLAMAAWGAYQVS